MATVEGRPLNCMHISLEAWSKMTNAQRAEAKRSATPYVPSATPATATASIPEDRPLNDIRDWNEEIDGIPGERLKNCVIFLLDEKKDPWYRLNLTESFIRRTLKSGITGARKIHEDTPAGWTPDPLFKIKTFTYEGEVLERREPRAPKNAEEWETLHSMLIGAGGKVNPLVLRLLAKSNCMKCRGRGGYNEKVFPDSKRRRWQEFFRCPCACCHFNPFKNQAA